MQSPAVNVMVKAARLGGNVLLRHINRYFNMAVTRADGISRSPRTITQSRVIRAS